MPSPVITSSVHAENETGYEPISLQHERLPPGRVWRDLGAILVTMRTRWCVRLFSSDPVSYELIENVVVAAASAPSGANQQPWTFVVIADPEIKRRIREKEGEERDFYDHHITPEWRAALGPDSHVNPRKRQ